MYVLVRKRYTLYRNQYQISESNPKLYYDQGNPHILKNIQFIANLEKALNIIRSAVILKVCFFPLDFLLF